MMMMVYEILENALVFESDSYNHDLYMKTHRQKRLKGMNQC